jgi:hypothetical protein
LLLVLLVVDAAVGAYVIFYALRLKRRDKPAVLVTGVFTDIARN